MAKITKVQAARFKGLIQGLNDLMVEVRKKHKNAGYYLAMDTMNLMTGPSHSEGGRMSSLCQNVAEGETLCHSGGGDW